MQTASTSKTPLVGGNYFRNNIFVINKIPCFSIHFSGNHALSTVYIFLIIKLLLFCDFYITWEVFSKFLSWVIRGRTISLITSMWITYQLWHKKYWDTETKCSLIIPTNLRSVRKQNVMHDQANIHRKCTTISSEEGTAFSKNNNTAFSTVSLKCFSLWK